MGERGDGGDVRAAGAGVLESRLVALAKCGSGSANTFFVTMASIKIFANATYAGTVRYEEYGKPVTVTAPADAA